MPVDSSRLTSFSRGPDVLFVYGTLQFDAVLMALLGRIPEQVPASAPGYRAATLKGRVYPGFVVHPCGGSAPGAVLLNLSNDEWRILDAFEDKQYGLREVPLSNGKLGWAYVWPGGDVEAADWSVSEFEENHLEKYAARCARIAPGLAAGEPKSEWAGAAYGGQPVVRRSGVRVLRGIHVAIRSPNSVLPPWGHGRLSSLPRSRGVVVARPSVR